MTSDQFIATWQDVTLKEWSAPQSHFIDLCRLLGEPTPVEADPTDPRVLLRAGRRQGRGRGWLGGCVAPQLLRLGAVAYGWADDTHDLPDDEILRRRLALNLERATSGAVDRADPEPDQVLP